MDTFSAFGMGQATKNDPPMVFDWEKAARIIKERNANSASAGLARDWEWTGGTILRDGRPVDKEDTYVYLASTWATPELEVGGEVMDCFRYQKDSPGWGAETYWPEEALRILEG